MKAYLNNPQLKADLIGQLQAHRAADHFIRGSYGEGEGDQFRGCAVGCSIESLNRISGSCHCHSDHSCYEPGFGVPQLLAKLQDRLFEGMPKADAMEWPLQFWEAIEVGADLTMVWPRFAHWMLNDPNDGVIRFAKTENVRNAILAVTALFERWIGGDKPSLNEWRDAAAAYAAAYAADAAAAADGARSAAYNKQSLKLIELMKAAPVDVAA